jgi:methylase of polypeptide subunit release factors
VAAMDDRDEALVELGRELQAAGYRFVTVTPETHRRRLANDASRGRPLARDARDVFGWSKPFRADLLPPRWVALLRRGDVLDENGDEMHARIRASTLGEDLFFHSAYPTTSADAVFFGPDTYRYARLVEQAARTPGTGTVVDVGCGAGPGGIAALRAGLASRALLVDVNEAALRLTRVNAAIAKLDGVVSVVESDVLAAVGDPIDVVVTNPPYLKDPGARTYRDGGGAFGEALAVRIVREALARVRSGGRIVVYTGVAIVDGEDVFLREIEPLCRGAGARWSYEEVDPDVFGEELDTPPYVAADRIAAVGLHVELP